MADTKTGDAGYRVLTSADLGALRSDERDFAYDVFVGLSERPKHLPSRYFYDDLGSELFHRIMGLDAYYPTRAEREILEAHKGEIVDVLAEAPVDIIDLGAGDGEKTLVLLEHLARRSVEFRYVPIDISEGAMRDLVDKVRSRMPKAAVSGLVCEYVDGVRWVGAHETGRKKVVLFLGSNIGNFDRAHARAFLRRLWSALREGDRMLIGFDLKKDIEVLLRAYNDEEGVTARFNLNLLTRINRELGGHFDITRFRHFGTYDVFSGAMKSYLVSLEAQTVSVDALQHSFRFEPWEPIHTEYSYKYLRNDVVALARDTSFIIDAEFLDQKKWFLSSLWRVDKSPARR